MNDFVDRYVFTALRRIPEQQRADIDRELRASIEDAVEARMDAGQSREAAVESALTELGDPDRLADRYAGRPGYLIGPDLFPLWRRFLKMLLWTVLPIVLGIGIAVQLFEDPDIGKIIGRSISALLTVGGQICFWVTLVFAILERTGVGRADLRTTWSPKDLPKYEQNRDRLVELATGLVWVALLIAGLVLQQFTFSDVPLLDPANWAFWWPVIIALFLLRGFYYIWVYRLGTRTRTVAAVNAVLVTTYTVPLVWLLATDRFFNPEFHGFLDLHGGGTRTWLNTLIIAILVIGGLWDVFDTARKAEQARKGQPAKVPGTGGSYDFTR
ncbi:hypothetical protein BJY16_003482 [Actinoplanes octamycinicus]|uniref:Uncharacterized protein n=1 Tax=Actinoplanes octamycinicus TaxID=135948 RepID=A0A7W7GXD2_9ACTN|nr:permease prefix domain 1-containing protein [Actinoplanes octamycinicus]MBB4740023.1 hypothetical protein [Actinoplanes octamycinicus]GIE59419.1 hypothetical protein Aoc01nite_48210 [Actinoplanes octamycinicus]